MTELFAGQTNRLLGYPADTRLLIINADDFGMCNAINEAIIQALGEGLVHSTSLMVPCPWALQAMSFLKENPHIPFGIHLTVICDADGYAWGPLTCREQVPLLVDRFGHFFDMDHFPANLDHNGLVQLEREFRAQIEAVLVTGLKPTHLDWHCLHVDEQEDICTLLLHLAKEYGLALRVTGSDWIKTVQSEGLPCNDHNLIDSWMVDPDNKLVGYSQLLHELPPGLSEWAVHPGIDHPELLALEPDGNRVRQSDFDFWTSQRAKDIIKVEGIYLIDYRVIQPIWREH